MEAFLREEMILGSAAMERLRRSHVMVVGIGGVGSYTACLLYTSPSPRDKRQTRMPASA